MLQEIGAIEALKTVASSPDGAAPRYARKALEIIGEELPYKLSQKVPQWTINDVKYWVTKVIKLIKAKRLWGKGALS